MARSRSESTPPAAKDAREHAGGFTLDLSAGRPARRRRRKTEAVVMSTIDLSSKAKPAAAPAPPPPPDATHAAAPPSPRERDRGRNSGGHSLADLLDPETLARLRGTDGENR